MLLDYDWPGNIRELENVIERAVNIAETDSITKEDIPPKIKRIALLHTGTLPMNKNILKNKEHDTIVQILSETNGNLRIAAKKLGIARSTLYEKLKRYNIPANNFRK